jgi:hypothetical protein
LIFSSLYDSRAVRSQSGEPGTSFDGGKWLSRRRIRDDAGWRRRSAPVFT